jgi:hypothetical protein
VRKVEGATNYSEKQRMYSTIRGGTFSTVYSMVRSVPSGLLSYVLTKDMGVRPVVPCCMYGQKRVSLGFCLKTYRSFGLYIWA